MKPDFKALGLDTFEEIGRYYGYPDCCIQAFAKFEHMFVITTQIRQLFGTGFVPCMACCSSKTEDELVAEINERRQHPTPLKPYFTQQEY